MTLSSNLSAAQLSRAVRVKEQIEKLESDLRQILASSNSSAIQAPSRRYNLSVQARERIAAAQRKRWAAFRKAKA